MLFLFRVYRTEIVTVTAYVIVTAVLIGYTSDSDVSCFAFVGTADGVLCAGAAGVVNVALANHDRVSVVATFTNIH